MVTKIFQQAYERNKDNFVVVQVGANDGVTNDPLYKFLQGKDVKGVLIEPQRDAYYKLCQNYKGTSLKTEHCAVWHEKVVMYRIKKSKRQEIYDNYSGQDATGLSSVSRNQLITFLKTRNYKFYAGINPDDYIESFAVKCMTPQQLMTKHNIKHIDILQVDAEGMDAIIVTEFLKLLRPRVINFEYKHCKDQVEGVVKLLKGYHITTNKGDLCAYQ